jgi:glutathione S-transferase
MTQPLPILLSGAPGSPYTRKMLALLRYRQLTYRFMIQGSAAQARMPAPRVSLLPTFYVPGADGALEAITDSTPIIRRLEAEHEGRSALPGDPAVRFLNDLIEDYADEWLTKAMFHYRWSYAADIAQAGLVLPCWRGLSIPDDVLAARAAMIRERQIGRLHVVGSNAVTGPVIEASYRRFLEAFEALLREQPYILGRRPGSADFAVYGQLTQLATFDPTPMALTVSVAPRVFAWVGIMEDLSGLDIADDGWIDPVAVPDALVALLREIGRVYPPVMLANAAAAAERRESFETIVDGQPWTQPPFPYQAKCLQWLRADHADLPPASRVQVDALMAATGCDALFA